MHILIAGASGFIGSLLTNHLAFNHNVTVLGRDLWRLEVNFPKVVNRLTWDNLAAHNARQYNLIINLSGSNIGAKRWSPKIKQELIDSRTKTNQQLLAWLIKHGAKPRFFCANAVGIYGAQEDSSTCFDEESPLPQTSNDFLQHIGLVWEQSLIEAYAAKIPVLTLRFGVVLKQGEGMLKKLELPFRLGLGSVLGAGNQVLSWIYYQDLIRAVDFLIAHEELTGPVNLTSPNPVTQREFAQQLAKNLKRPIFFKTNEVIVKLIFGEMGEYLLLKGQRVLPKRLTGLGFEFNYPTLESMLAAEFVQAPGMKSK